MPLVHIAEIGNPEPEVFGFRAKDESSVLSSGDSAKKHGFMSTKHGLDLRSRAYRNQTHPRTARSISGAAAATEISPRRDRACARARFESLGLGALPVQMLRVLIFGVAVLQLTFFFRRNAEPLLEKAREVNPIQVTCIAANLPRTFRQLPRSPARSA